MRVCRFLCISPSVFTRNAFVSATSLCAIAAALLVANSAGATEIYGYVFDRDTGAPMMNVPVTLYDMSGPTGSPVNTISTGRYSFIKTVTRQMRFSARAVVNGHNFMCEQKWVNPTDASIRLPDINISLGAVAHKVYGYVKNKQGQGVTGLKVDLSSNSQVLDSKWTITNGYYEFAGKVTASGVYGVSVWRNNTLAGINIFSVDISAAGTRVPDIIVDTGSTTYSISGTVRDAATNQALQGVSVARSQGASPVTTNASGYFSFSSVPANQSYTLTFSKNGYISTSKSIDTLTSNTTANTSLTSDRPLYAIAPETVTPSVQASGQQARVSVCVTNFGQTRVHAFSIGVHASLNNFSSVSAGDIRLGAIPVPPTGVESNVQATFENTFDLSPLEDGVSYYVKANVDEHRTYPRDSVGDNVLASRAQIARQAPPAATELILDRFRITGTITQTTPYTYSVAPNGTINQFVSLENGATIDTAAHTVRLSNQGLKLKPSPLTGGKTGELSIVKPQPMLTLSSINGRILEGSIFDNYVLYLGALALKMDPLTIGPYQGDYRDNEITGGFQLAIPVSVKAILSLLKNPTAYGHVFLDERDDWAYIESAGTFRPTSFALDISYSSQEEPIPFLLGFNLIEASGGFDSRYRSIKLSGAAETTYKRQKATLSLDEFSTIDYVIPNTIAASLELDRDFVLVPVPWSLPGAKAYVVGFYKLGLRFEDITNAIRRETDFRAGVEFGLSLGGLKVFVPYHGWSLLRFLDIDAKGDVALPSWDVRGEGEAKLLVYKGYPRDFTGFDLLSVECELLNSEDRFWATAEFNLGDIFRGHGFLNIDTRANAFSSNSTGSLSIPTTVPLIGGLQFGEANARGTTTAETASITGTARCVFLPAVGFIFNSDGSWDVGTDLYKKYLQKCGASKEPIRVYVPTGQNSAIIRLSYASGETDASLTAPTAPEPTVYTKDNAAIRPGYSGPVFCRANDAVVEEGQACKEICFFLIPPQGETEVLSGYYYVEMTLPGKAGDAHVELWLSNEPPAITISEPSFTVTIDPLLPQPVHIAFEGNDPLPDAEDVPDYDPLRDVEINLFYDADREGYDGQLINCISTPDYVGPAPIRLNQMSFEWDTTGVATGEYYIYASISDGRNKPVFSDYAPGMVTIRHAEAPSTPTGFVAQVTAEGIACSWTASVPSEKASVAAVTYVILYDDQPADSPERFENALQTEGECQWTVRNLPFGKTYRFAVAAMNPETYSRSLPSAAVAVPYFNGHGNNAPKITSTPVTEGRVGFPYEYQVQGEDPDGDTLFFELVHRDVDGHPELVSPPPGITIDPDSGLIEFTPVDGHLGSNRVEVKVSDNKGGTDTQEFYIQIDNWLTPNGAPVFDDVPPQTVLVDAHFELTVHAEDPEGESVTYAFLGAVPEGMTIDPDTGVIRWQTTTADAGSHAVTIQASDAKGGISDPPLAVTLEVEYPALALNQSQPFTVSPASPQPSPVRMVFKAQPESRYVENYTWDFGDGSPVVTGPDKQVVDHTFNYDLPDDGDLEDRLFSVHLTVEGPGYPDVQTVDATRQVAVRPPTPVADFTADRWAIQAPDDLAVLFNENAAWATEYAWDFGDAGATGAGETASHTFTAETFPRSYLITLTVTSPTGVNTVQKRISYLPHSGSVHVVMDNPEEGDDPWPGWHEATRAEIDLPTLLEPTDITLGQNTGTLTLNTGLQGSALALSEQYAVGTQPFRLDVHAGPAELQNKWNWTWMGGEEGINTQASVYGTQGVPDPANFPGKRVAAVSWTDSSGKLWLFGGCGDEDRNGLFINDLWRYDPATGDWTWMKGPNVPDQYGVYGAQGLPDPANTPGARAGAVSWTDNSGHLWVFGGYAFDSVGSLDDLNDLWRYDLATNNWTWMGGANTAGQSGVYGTQGVPDPGNMPGAREHAVSWTDSAGNLWLFGGSGPDGTGAYGSLNDLWKYDVPTGIWTWMEGANLIDQPGVYGTQGVPDPGNMPGARLGAVSWTDSSGNLWLFGGFGLDGTGAYGSLNDLWKYDVPTGIWTWMKGANLIDQPGVYGTQGVPDSANIPGARAGAVSWTDSAGNLWLFGGGNDGNSFFGDLWRYDPATGDWTWMKGPNVPNQPGIYGTQGVEDPSNMPGARFISMVWVDTSGRLWLFGGVGLSDYNQIGLNDLWRYDPATGNWTFVKGPKHCSTPSARSGAASWTDSSGDLWLFGGYSWVSGVLTKSYSEVYISDLWKYSLSAGDWTWEGGNSVPDTPGTYGTLEIPDPSNIPGARADAVSWTDSSGNLWLFGGWGWGWGWVPHKAEPSRGRLNDLWRYEPANGNWTWMGGSDLTEGSGVYGTQGVPDPGNMPGAREHAVSWTDSAGNLWLFGGSGPDGTGAYGSLNDLWKYDVPTGIWTWMAGANLVDQSGVYGTQGVPDPANMPGARESAVSWTDKSGNFWLFGGFGFDGAGEGGGLNDLWRYDPATGDWTWMKGPNVPDQYGVYGAQGLPDPANTPGARAGAVSWTDNSGHLWVFGGYGFDRVGSLNDLNDLWRYDLKTANWTWIKGSDVVNDPGMYGFEKVPGAANTPSARHETVSWTDSSDSMWLFGGAYREIEWDEILSDLWHCGRETNPIVIGCVFSPNAFVLLSVTGPTVTLGRYSISEGEVVVEAEATRTVPALAPESMISVDYDGAGHFRVLADGVYTGVAISGVPGSEVLTLGLGFENPSSESAEQVFHTARLWLTNQAPTFTSLPQIDLSPGGSTTVNLNNYFQDDMTPDEGLVFSFASGETTLDVDGVYRAIIDPATHVLQVTAAGSVSIEYTGALQIVVVDEDGIGTTAELQIQIFADVPDALFTNIASVAGIDIQNGVGAAVNDLPGDAWQDLAVTMHADCLVVYTNTGTLPMDNRTAARGLDSATNMSASAYGDLDGDGLADMVFTGTVESLVYLSDTPGHFSPHAIPALEAETARGLSLADADHDGDLDLYLVRNGANILFKNLLKETGSFDFADATVASGLGDTGEGESTVFCDVDLDGDLDCYVVNRGGANALYLNDGAGVFAQAIGSNTEMTGDSYGAAFADFNNDGYPDLYVANDGNDALLINDGDPEGDGWNGTFTDITASSGIINAASSRSVCALDYDNDGWLDIFVSNNGAPNVLYRNDGSTGGGWAGAFTDVNAESGVRGLANNAGMGAVTGDVDKDGDVDIFQVNAIGQPAALFRNNVLLEAPGRHWLQVQLLGTVSNAFAIGARIDLMKDGQVWQTREASGSSGWRSQSSLVQHFGMGADAFAEELVVYWPSGNVTRRHFEPAGQRLVITEAYELVAIQIIPGRVTVAQGEIVAFTAEGIYANGDLVPLTATELYWEVADPGMAYVDENGLVLALLDGVTYLTARQGDLTSYPAEIIVSDRSVVSLMVEPTSAQAPIGGKRAFTAIASYDDGSTDDVTTNSDWFSAPPSVATIGRSGQALAVAEGEAMLMAEYLGTASNTATLTVVPGGTSTLTALPNEVRSYADGLGRPNKVAVHETVGVTPAEDVTRTVAWESTDPFVAWVDGGVLWTRKTGTAELTARSGSVESNPVSLEVRDHIRFISPPPIEATIETDRDYTMTAWAEGGYPPLEYQWFKETAGKALVPTGIESPIYTIADVQFTDAGTYVIQVNDQETDVAENTTILYVEQGVPAAGWVALVLLIGLVALATALAMRRFYGKVE